MIVDCLPFTREKKTIGSQFRQVISKKTQNRISVRVSACFIYQNLLEDPGNEPSSRVHRSKLKRQALNWQIKKINKQNKTKQKTGKRYIPFPFRYSVCTTLQDVLLILDIFRWGKPKQCYHLHLNFQYFLINNGQQALFRFHQTGKKNSKNLKLSFRYFHE